MPKHTRTTSSSHNRYSNSMPVSLAPATAAPMYAARMPMPTMQQTYYSMPGAGPSSMQSQQQATYDPYGASATPQPQIPSIPQHRASSGAWTGGDDQRLLSARAQGLNWGQIQSMYFANKTANACRKRHERLMERKGADDWDTRKLEQLAKEYMTMRKEIWQGLAARTGEKWNVVESKCMSNGLKNLQSAARSAARRERLETGQPIQGYDDDSGISGIGLTPVDDLDASYSSPETTGSGSAASAAGSSHSVGSSGYPQHAHHHAAHAAAAYSHSFTQSAPVNYGYHSGPHHGYTSSVSSTGTNGGAYAGHGASQSGSPYLPHGQRMSSVDMGIDAIINRPGGGAL